ncbi:MAG: hypothetical protein KGD68_04780 [Candidatus Lokiarchaeota archaeon]|nr:hypothetical protein [Candidatus Lokiarchaeota archaeon]
MNKKLLKWEIFGAIFISIVGALFHFMFEWLGSWPPIGGIFPVNESVWEHLKLPYWPLIIYSLVEHKFITENSNNLIFAKTLAILIDLSVILITFYTFTAILGVELLIIDILSFIIGVFIGQYVSAKVMSLGEKPKWVSYISWIIFIALGLLFIIFTYLPPNLPIFLDSESGMYGII